MTDPNTKLPIAPPPNGGTTPMLWPDTAAAMIAVFEECGIEVADALLRSAKAKGVTLT